MKLSLLFFNNKASVLLTLSMLWVFFGFKIGVIPINGSLEHGVRLDDIVLILLFSFLIIKKVDLMIIHPEIKYYFYFVIFSLASFLINFALGNVDLGGVLYVVRLIEYMIFFYIGRYLTNSELIDKFLIFYLLYLLFIMLAQKFLLLNIGVSFDNRPGGNLGGPWESAMVGSFLVFYFLSKKHYLFTLLALIVVLMAASRIMVFAVFVVIFYNYFWKSNKIVSIVGLLSMILLIGISDIEVLSRFLLLFQTDIFGLFDNYLEEIKALEMTREGYFYNAYEVLNINAMSDDGDASTLIRVFRWLYLVMITFNSNIAILIGSGPSFASLAVDGYYVRVFTETGLIGLGFFIWFLSKIYRYFYSYCKFMSYYLIVLIITALFLDDFVAFKPMMFLWLFLGVAAQKNNLSFKKFEIEQLGEKKK
ncbi:hypothetical protein [Sulfuricurvum sp.]|uniref:hypothetical protein n=1 Tax=Sulfuricurvum sp. TaxID=2025608 RepID=UPI003BB4BC9E